MSCRRTKWSWIRCCAVLCVGLLVTAARAQPLADRIPDDAVVYLGWRGADPLLSDYEQSTFKQFMDASNIPEVFSELLPRLVDKAIADGAPREWAAWKEIIPILYRHPAAFYVSEVRLQEGILYPETALICSAGDEAPRLAELLGSLDLPGPGEVDFVAGHDRGLAWLASPRIAERLKTPARTLGDRPAFKQVSDGLTPGAALVGFIDSGWIIDTINELHFETVGADPNRPGPHFWLEYVQAFLPKGLNTITFTAGFDGKDWITTIDLHAPSPRTGALSLLEVQPLSEETLRLVPRSATSVQAFRLDPQALLTQLREGFAKLGPADLRQFNQALGFGNLMLGTNIEQNLLAALGDEWIAYRAPDIAGGAALTTVLANRLREPDKAARALSAVDRFINTIVAGQLQRSRSNVVVRIREATIDDFNLHYLATPFVAPSWLVHDGVLYLGAYPEVVVAAARFATSDGPSVLDNPALQQARQQAGNQPLASVHLDDLPALAKEAYPLDLVLERLYMGFADLLGLEAPALVLPPMHKLQPLLSMSSSVSFTDDAGWHYRAREPFPGSMAFSGVPGAAAMQAPSLLAAMLPSLAQARSNAQGIASMSNLRQIFVGMMMYSNDHQGMLPPNLGALVQGRHLPPQSTLFVSPGGSPPANVPPGPDAALDQFAQWVNENSSYEYLLANVQLNKIKSRQAVVVAYEKHPDRRGEIALLYADGSIQRKPLAAARMEIERTRAQYPGKQP